MINDAFETLHLQQRKITASPLFNNAKQAFIGQSYGHKFHSKYIVIESTLNMPENIFKEGNICPIFIYQNRSYIFQEGQSLYHYFLSKKDSDLVLCEQQIWKLLTQISKALLVLKNSGFDHRHIKEQAIRRIGANTYKIIYHPTMNSAQTLIQQNIKKWNQFYLAPEQVADLTLQASNSCVFSLAAMILNIMNPLDFNRDIYCSNQYKICQNVMQQKISNASLIYSKQIMNIVKKMLNEDYEKRPTLEQIISLADKMNPFNKKMYLTNTMRSIVNSKLEKSRQRALQSKSKEKIEEKRSKGENGHRIINFQRGTFGGRRQTQHSQEQVQEQQRQLETAEIPQSKAPQKDKNLKKNDSQQIPKVQVQPNNRSYSQYLQTIKKPKQQHSKNSQGDTNEQSGKIRLQFNIPPEGNLSNSNSTTYNDYIRSNQKTNKNKYNASFSAHDLNKKDDLIKISDSASDTDKISQNSKKISQNSLRQEYEKEYSNSNNKVPKSIDNSMKIEEENIQTSLKFFDSRIGHYHIKLAQCLNQPKDIAKKLGFQGVYINGNVYYGQFKNGRRNGLALEVFQNGQYYYGHYRDDMFHGQGFYYWNGSQHFLGSFQAGVKVEGTWLGKNKYVGQVKSNKRHGIGTYTYSNGKKYEGEWFMGKRHGSGIIIEPSGDKFVGTFKMGKKFGRGTLLINDCRYTGIWQDEAPKGQIEIIFPSGRRYNGQINQHFQMHGKGQLKFTNRTHCRGQFEEDRLVLGEVFYNNGDHYIGQLKDFMRHGEGTYTDINGKKRTGIWQNNVLNKK